MAWKVRRRFTESHTFYQLVELPCDFCQCAVFGTFDNLLHFSEVREEMEGVTMTLCCPVCRSREASPSYKQEGVPSS